MPDISIKNTIPVPNIQIGECVFLQDGLTTSSQLINLDGGIFLRSGTTLINQETEYPISFEKFGYHGIRWIQRTSGVSSVLTTIEFLQGSLIACGASGVILTSPDGITWTSRTSGTLNQINGVAFGNSTYVAVGNSGDVRTSPDGITWTSRTSGTANGLNSTAFGAGLFVAVGDSGTVRTSPDGITWTSRTSGIGNTLRAVKFNTTNNLFIAVGTAGTIITSPDGITWTTRTSNTTNSLLDLTTFSVGSGFPGWSIAVGGLGEVIFSSNGTSWNAIPAFVNNSTLDFCFADNSTSTVVIGSNNTDGIMWWSKPLSSFEKYVKIPTNFAVNFNSMVYDGAKYIVVGNGGTILTSTKAIGVFDTIKNNNSTLYMRIK